MLRRSKRIKGNENSSDKNTGEEEDQERYSRLRKERIRQNKRVNQPVKRGEFEQQIRNFERKARETDLRFQRNERALLNNTSLSVSIGDSWAKQSKTERTQIVELQREVVELKGTVKELIEEVDYYRLRINSLENQIGQEEATIDYINS